MKILIFGKNGQVGQSCVNLLHEKKINFLAVGRKECDLLNNQKIEELLCNFAPDIIINAAAYTAVDLSETDDTTAFKINSSAPLQMAKYAKTKDALLIHYSTEYVYDGLKKTAYIETDCTNPLNVYGKSKLEGEQNIVASGCKYVILRTSWVYSEYSKNFVKTIHTLAKTKDSIQVVSDQFGSPTSASLIAEGTLKIIEKFHLDTVRYGTYHFCSNGITNWHEFATLIVSQALKNGNSLTLSPQNIFKTTSAAYKTIAKRPQNSVMNNELFQKAFNFKFPLWSDEFCKVPLAKASRRASAVNKGN